MASPEQVTIHNLTGNWSLVSVFLSAATDLLTHMRFLIE